MLLAEYNPTARTLVACDVTVRIRVQCAGTHHRTIHFTVMPTLRRLGGVVVSVLATGPKNRGFEPGQGDGFLRAITIRSTPSFEWEVKQKIPCRKTLRPRGRID
jgi:hypothetical protein